MARTANPEIRTVRREAFVEAATRLIQTVGYEQMSVQDVLDAVDASRGAFYHYFDSKAALLEAVLERMIDAVLESVMPGLADPGTAADEKLQRLFGGIAGWKNARRDLVLALTRIWYSDDNAIVREKFAKTMLARMSPVLGAVIEQGTAEGVFHVSAPAAAARVLLSVLQGAQNIAGELLLARQAGRIPFEAVAPAFAAYSDAFERILAARPGSLRFVDDETLRIWFA